MMNETGRQKLNEFIEDIKTKIPNYNFPESLPDDINEVFTLTKIRYSAYYSEYPSIRNQAYIYEPKKKDVTYLSLAAEHGRYDICKLLLENDADVDILVSGPTQKFNALQIAIWSMAMVNKIDKESYLSIIKIMGQETKNIDFFDNSTEKSGFSAIDLALNVASYYGRDAYAYNRFYDKGYNSDFGESILTILIELGAKPVVCLYRNIDTSGVIDFTSKYVLHNFHALIINRGFHEAINKEIIKFFQDPEHYQVLDSLHPYAKEMISNLKFIVEGDEIAVALDGRLKLPDSKYESKYLYFSKKTIGGEELNIINNFKLALNINKKPGEVFSLPYNPEQANPLDISNCNEQEGQGYYSLEGTERLQENNENLNVDLSGQESNSWDFCCIL